MRLPPCPLARSVALLALALASPAARAQTPDSTGTYHHDAAPVIHAARLTGSIHLDGVLDEAAWSAAEPMTTFTQLDPREGQPASEPTEVRVLIGDDALYVGARLRDHEARKIRARLARRDDAIESDAF